MNGWAILFFVLVVGALILFIVVQRRDPAQADEIAGTADGWYKRLLARLRR